MGVQPLTRQAV